jgi:hypothetical protein
MIKLYVNQQIVAYNLLENHEARTDKTTLYEGELYQDLGVVHFVTMPEYRKKGYASLVVDVMYKDVIQPLLARYSNTNVYVSATEKVVPLMQRHRYFKLADPVLFGSKLVLHTVIYTNTHLNLTIFKPVGSKTMKS